MKTNNILTDVFNLILLSFAQQYFCQNNKQSKKNIFNLAITEFKNLNLRKS